MVDSMATSVYGWSPSHQTARHLYLLGQGLRLQSPLLSRSTCLRHLLVGPIGVVLGVETGCCPMCCVHTDATKGACLLCPK